MSALILVLMLGQYSIKTDSRCEYLPTDPMQTRCTWIECDSSEPPVCRAITETTSQSCICTDRRSRVECDLKGENCKTWSSKKEK